MKKLLSLTMAALATTSAFAGGYRVSLQGQKQLAMGHTGVAVVNSAETLFFNPAGASFLKDRFNFSIFFCDNFSKFLKLSTLSVSELFNLLSSITLITFCFLYKYLANI